MGTGCFALVTSLGEIAVKRFYMACLGFFWGLNVLAAPGAHGPNGEHLDIPAGAAVAGDSAPQFETMSEFLEITGHLHTDSQQLRLYINHFDDSEPVVDAGTEVEVQVLLPSGDITAEAPLDKAEGAYVVSDKKLLEALQVAGEYPLMLTVIGPEGSRYGSDLLEAKLHVPQTGEADAATSQEGSWLARVPLSVWLVLTAVLALRLLADALRWGRQRAGVAS